MKIDRRRQILLVVSALSFLTATNALSIKDAAPALDASKEDLLSSDLHNAGNVAEVKATNLGSETLPYDGKDGMPHDGPFVETNAERERKKKSKASDETEQDSEPASLKSYEDGLKVKDIPKSNEGVMDDRNRKAPAEGTRGTEGGISEKSKGKNKGSSLDTDEKAESKKPDPPKEQPPLPHSENLRIQGKDDDDDNDNTGTADTEAGKETKKLLEKPADLPSKPHSIPLPENPSSPKDHSISHDSDSLSSSSSQTTTDSPKLKFDDLAGVKTEDSSAVIQPMHSLLLSFTMIIFSEIGDKTFLVACLMAMRHDRILVFTAAFSALITMTVLSAVLGHTVPSLIPKSVTNFLAAALFLVFGVKMVLEARKISPDEGVSEEMKEVEMELEEKEHAAQRRISRHQRTSSNLVTPYMLESGRKLPSPPSSPSSTSSSRSNSPSRRRGHGHGRGAFRAMLGGLNNLLSLLLSPAWVQTFVMTFLGEWGDRSQIATIAMAAGQDYWWVTGGALGGHAICTGMAVIGGKAIAGRVSLRTVTMAGASAFLVFGFIYLAEAIY